MVQTRTLNASRRRNRRRRAISRSSYLSTNGSFPRSLSLFSLFPVTYPSSQMNLIISRLSPIPQLSVIYRATSPGHSNCNLLTVPYSSSQAAQIGESNLVERLIETLPDDRWRTHRKRWDWDLFAVHNALWEREIAKMERWKEREGGASWLFMDVWDQALQRPDAHTEPGTDCLHCKSLRWFLD